VGRRARSGVRCPWWIFASRETRKRPDRRDRHVVVPRRRFLLIVGRELRESLHRYSPARGCQRRGRTTAFPVDKAASERRGSARHRGRFKDLVVHVGFHHRQLSLVPVEAAGGSQADRETVKSSSPPSRRSAELPESPTIKRLVVPSSERFYVPHLRCVYSPQNGRSASVDISARYRFAQ